MSTAGCILEESYQHVDHGSEVALAEEMIGVGALVELGELLEVAQGGQFVSFLVQLVEEVFQEVVGLVKHLHQFHVPASQLQN